MGCSAMSHLHSLLVLGVCVLLLQSGALSLPSTFQQDASTMEEELQTSPTPEATSTPPATSTVTSTAPENCTKNQTSSSRSFSEKRQVMLDSVRGQVLFKLNMTEAPVRTQAALGDLPASLISDYLAQLNALEQNEEAPQDRECQGGESTHFSRHLGLYYPNLFVSEDPPLDHFQLGKTIALTN